MPTNHAIDYRSCRLIAADRCTAAVALRRGSEETALPEKPDWWHFSFDDLETPRKRHRYDKYLKNHLTLLRDVYGDSVERIELRTPRKGTASTDSDIRRQISPRAAHVWIRK